MLRDRFKSELQKAMKSREALKVSTLRLILAAIKDRDLDFRSKGNGEVITDSNILEILSKMVKQRKETISIYKKAGRIATVEILRDFPMFGRETTAIISVVPDDAVQGNPFRD